MENKFFGRQEYLDILRKRVSGLKLGYRQNIAVLGDELVGKTSLICNFLNNFYDNEVLIVYLQVRPETISAFAKRFIGVLFYNFLINSAAPLKEDLNFLLVKSEKYIPKAAAKARLILGLLETRKRNNIFSELLSLCEIIKQETGKSSVVIFDEFHNLESLGVKNLYPEWSKLLMTQKDTMYIIVSSLKFKAKTILSKNLSLLFGNFEVMEVEPFDIKTSEEFLEAGIQGSSLDPGLDNFIVHFTGGYPFYLNLISESLLKSGYSGLGDILENLLFESSGILNQKFSNYIKRFLDSSNSQQYLSILYQIASGHNKIRDIAHLLRLSKKDLSLRINNLLEFDAISRHGDFLKINDRVFSFWLKFVYQEKLNSFTFDAKNQKALFREYIENGINEFLLQANKPLAERLTELLRLFSDDTIQINRKRLRLSHFREIKPLEFSNRSLKDGLLGRSSDSLWIMAFKPDTLTEDFVADFARECKRYRHKVQHKVIVTLQEIDTNTRLRAMEEKILMWDVDNLNQILDLFSKPRVIA